MIVETGRVVAVEADGVWVETANQSACGSCAARKGCGQSLLAQMQGHRSYIKAIWRNESTPRLQEGDLIEIGIQESAVTRGSLLVYCLPLLGLVVGSAIGDAGGLPEGGVVLAALAGLGFAGAGVRWLSRLHDTDERYQPVVIGKAVTPATAVQHLEVEVSRP